MGRKTEGGEEGLKKAVQALVYAGDFRFHAELMLGTECRAVGVQQSFVPGTETEFDKSARVRGDLGLPSVFRLIANHRVLCALVPNAGRFAIEIMLTNERRLNLPGALGTDGVLPAGPGCSGGRALAFGCDGARPVLGVDSRVAHLCSFK